MSDNLPLRPWVGFDKPEVVEIVPTEVTGRRFPLSRPCCGCGPTSRR